MIFYDMDKVKKDEKMFMLWLNTNFLHLHQPYNSSNSIPHRKFLGPNDIVVRIPKVELDKAVKDKKNQAFDADFYVDLIIEVKEPSQYSEPHKFVYNTPDSGKELFGEIQQYAKTEASSKEKEKARKQYEQGREFFALKQYSNAVTSFSNAILIDSGFEEAYMSRGLANMNLKRFPEAIYDFTTVLNILAKGTTSLGEDIPIQDSITITLRAYHSRGKCHTKMKEYEFAIKDYDSATSILEHAQHIGNDGCSTTTVSNNNHSTSPFTDSLFQTFFRVYLDRGLINDALQKYSDCIIDYTNFIKYMDPLSESLVVKLREGKITANKYEQYLFELFQAFYNKAIAIGKVDNYPNKETQVFHDLNKAVDYIEKMSDPINSPDALVFGQVYLARGDRQTDKEAAINDFLKCLLYDKTNRIATKRLAVLLYEQKQYKRAVLYFSKLIKDEPQNVKMLTNRAICYLKLELYENAIADFKAAQNLSPDTMNLYVQCARCYRRKHELSDPAQIPQKELEDCEVQYSTAIDYLQKRKKAATPSTPSTPTLPSSSTIKDDDLKTLYFERGMTRFALKKYESAILDYSHCLELDPNHSLALYNRAYTRQKFLKQYDKAITDYEQVLTFNSSDLKARLEKGCCLYYLKKDEEAIMEWQLVLKKDPNNEAAKVYLSQLAK